MLDEEKKSGVRIQNVNVQHRTSNVPRPTKRNFFYLKPEKRSLEVLFVIKHKVCDLIAGSNKRTAMTENGIHG